MTPGITISRVARLTARACWGAATAASLCWAVAACAPAPPAAHAVAVLTPDVRYRNPAVVDQDDMCIWVDEQDSSRSTLIASDKSADRLFVYDLDGQLLQTLDLDKPGNIDTRPGFRLAGKTVSIVAVNSRLTRLLAVYAVDPASRLLTRVDDGGIPTGAEENYGSCLYRSPATGAFFAFVTHKSGEIVEIALVDHDGKVSGRRVKDFGGRSITEGIVADDALGVVYNAEEQAGIWAWGAEPGDMTAPALIARVGEHGLTADVEGLALYLGPSGQGYLLASSQGSSTMLAYGRTPPHTFVGAFAVDGSAETDGIDVWAGPLGERYPHGAFFAHNGAHAPYGIDGLRWERVASALKLR